MVDDVDLKILRALQHDARIPNVALAEKIGLSPTPCWNRVKALEATGVIDKYVTIINQAALGFPETVVVEVTVEPHNSATFEQFDAALAKLPEVIEAYRVTGEYDYFIKIGVPSADGCDRFLKQRLHQLPGVRSTRASFVLKPLKQTYSLQISPGTVPSPDTAVKRKKTL